MSYALKKILKHKICSQIRLLILNLFLKLLYCSVSNIIILNCKRMAFQFPLMNNQLGNPFLFFFTTRQFKIHL